MHNFALHIITLGKSDLKDHGKLLEGTGSHHDHKPFQPTKKPKHIKETQKQVLTCK